MILSFFSNLIVVFSSILLVKNFFFLKSLADKILLCFLLFLAQIITVGLVSGIFHRFDFPTIILLHCLILFIVVLSSRNRKIFSNNKINVDFIFNNKLLLFAFSIFAGFFAVKFFNNLINPPTCPDSLQYHLAFPALWIKNANLVNPVSVFGAIRGTPELSWATYYPINAELFFAWLILPLKNAFLADLGEAPFYLIGIIAVYSILRKFSVDKAIALFSGLIWVLIPNLFKELKSGAQIDVICAVLFLLLFNFLLIFKEDLNIKTGIILGLSAGIFIGTKIINILWAQALLPLFIYGLLKNRKETSLKNILGVFLVISAGILVLGSYMYLKNFINSGNPFYPIQIKLFNNFVFPGLIDGTAFKSLYSYNYPNQMIDKLFSEGLGLQLIVFILPGTFLPLIFMRLIKERFKPLAKFLLLFLTPIFMLLIYLLFLNSGITRFIFPYLGMGLICGIVFLNKLNWGKKYIAILGFISIVSSAAELAHRTELIISFIISLFLFLVFLLWKNIFIRIFNSINSFKFFVICLLISITVLSFLNHDYNKNEFLRYSTVLSKKESWQKDIALGWRWLNNATSDGKRIAYVGRNETYPLLGSYFKNEVFYVPVNNKPFLPYDLTNGFYRKEKDVNAWENNIIKLNVDFLYIALPQKINNESENPRDFPIEDEWALLKPGLFNLVFSNSLVHIYKITYPRGR